MLIKLFRHPRFSGYALQVEGDSRAFNVQATGATGFTVYEEEPESKLLENDLQGVRLIEPKAEEAIKVYFNTPSVSIVTGNPLRP